MLAEMLSNQLGQSTNDWLTNRSFASLTSTMSLQSTGVRTTHLCQSRTSPTTWPSPGCYCASSPSLSAAAPVGPSAPSAPSEGGPSSPRLAHPAPAASEEQTKKAKPKRQSSTVAGTDRCCGGSGKTLPLTFMCSCARLKRLRVVFLTESDDSGICSLSCSRQCLSWARLQGKNYNTLLLHIQYVPNTFTHDWDRHRTLLILFRVPPGKLFLCYTP